MKSIAALLLWIMLFRMVAGTITIAENGKANADIVIPRNASFVVKYAAQELKHYLERMSGGSFQITETLSKPVGIYLGMGDSAGFANDSFRISAAGNRIDIFGKDDLSAKLSLFGLYYDISDRGTLMGIYEILDRLGVRWPAPGPGNDFVPKKQTIRIPEKNELVTPSFADRQTTNAYNFMSKYPDAEEYCRSAEDFFRWGIRIRLSTRAMVPGAHSERALKLYENKEWISHPERLQLTKEGKRDKNYSCWSDPAVKEVWMKAADAYFSGKKPTEIGLSPSPYSSTAWPYPFIRKDEMMIDPMDESFVNDGRCRCLRCEVFRKKYPCPDDTELIWRVIADVANQVKRKYPGKYISTLVYPPKRDLPKYCKIPDNIRLRVCISGPKEINSPNRLAGDLALIKKCSAVVGAKNLSLWAYQCIIFARKLPGPVETYPHLTAKYLQAIKPYSCGMFLESHGMNHTHRNLDIYIQSRLMWNCNRDVDAELSDYFNVYYGPAAEKAHRFFQRLESNWNTLWKLTVKDVHHPTSCLGMEQWKDNDAIQKRVWNEVYTLEEIANLEKMIAEIEKWTEKDPVYRHRAKLLRSYILAPMKQERSEVMEKEDIRKQFIIHAEKSENSPAGNQWNHAAAYSLVSASRSKNKLEAPGMFQVLHSDAELYIRVKLDEPQIVDCNSNISRKNGDSEIWKDNCIELFFYAPETKKFWQIIINDHGRWSSQTKGRVTSKWVQMPEVGVKTGRHTDYWTAEISIPLKELNLKNGELRFNLARTRNIRGKVPEYSTWSSLAKLGNWHNPEIYGIIVLK